ncbi:hypothetical protein CPB83DRAFT_863742 [Crepidotus variabilis]|uniref:Secreted protein n=1 Tax=Crepidotus variabilis TaxID=179855 RepID=A0A9P6E5L3_9AGAR|nr:hypothetical protein CPB83DRAFT_863742 [Crepidotus variabilis]
MRCHFTRLTIPVVMIARLSTGRDVGTLVNTQSMSQQQGCQTPRHKGEDKQGNLGAFVTTVLLEVVNNNPLTWTECSAGRSTNLMYAGRRTGECDETATTTLRHAEEMFACGALTTILPGYRRQDGIELCILRIEIKRRIFPKSSFPTSLSTTSPSD